MKYPLTGDYLANLPEPMQKLYRDLEDSIFEYICEQFKTGDANEKSIELIRLLQRRGLSLREIEKRIQRTLGLTKRELDRIYDGAISRNRAFFTDTLNKMKLVFDPKRRKAMEAEEAAIRAQTLDELTNITRSLGFATRGPDGRVVATPILEAYQRILDVAAIQVQSGAFSYNEAIQNAIKQLAASGVQWVDYESGWHNRVEVAVRRAVMTGISQLSARYSEQMRQEIGTDFVEVSAHRGARDKGIGPENHKSWQGKVYHVGGDTVADGVRYQDFERVTGYGTGEGLNGWNCRHKWYPFVPGIMERSYTDEELAKIDPPDFEFEGKTYTAYEATQKQRQLETAMRAKEREMIGYKAAGDEKAYTYAKARYRALSAEYKRFSKAAGLPEQRQRLKFAKDAENSLAISANNGNMPSRGIADRNMANGLRQSPSHILDDQEIQAVYADADSIGVPRDVLRFNTGARTGYDDLDEVINIRGDIFPDMTSTYNRDLLSSRAALAHEYYGHFMTRGTTLRPGDWRDEFRASYRAAKHTPNLTDAERQMLMRDALDRAKEAGVAINHTATVRRLLYGLDEK